MAIFSCCNDRRIPWMETSFDRFIPIFFCGSDSRIVHHPCVEERLRFALPFGTFLGAADFIRFVLWPLIVDSLLQTLVTETRKSLKNNYASVNSS